MSSGVSLLNGEVRHGWYGNEVMWKWDVLLTSSRASLLKCEVRHGWYGWVHTILKHDSIKIQVIVRNGNEVMWKWDVLLTSSGASLLKGEVRHGWYGWVHTVWKNDDKKYTIQFLWMSIHSNQKMMTKNTQFNS